MITSTVTLYLPVFLVFYKKAEIREKGIYVTPVGVCRGKLKKSKFL